MLSKRRGLVTVKAPAFFDESGVEMLEMITKDLIVVRADNNYVGNCIEYWAFSKHFEEVADNCAVPEYEAVLENGKVTYQKINS